MMSYVLKYNWIVRGRRVAERRRADVMCQPRVGGRPRRDAGRTARLNTEFNNILYLRDSLTSVLALLYN